MNDIYKNIDRDIQFGRTRTNNPMDTQKYEFHLHNFFEIYYLISGDINYFVEKNSYKLEDGDLLVMNKNEVHKPSFTSNRAYERVSIHFNPYILNIFSSEYYNLKDFFINRKNGENNRLLSNTLEKEKLYNMIMKLLSLKRSNPEYPILKSLYFIELVVFLNQIFKRSPSRENNLILPEKLRPIIDYIDSHLDSDLTLKTLEKQFFINRYYLSRLFKKSIGNSLHEYILIKRISLAKKLLYEGLNATEASNSSGFNDYSNFVKMFKRFVGTTPSLYKKKHRADH